MFVQPDADPREQGGPVSGERDILVRYLRDYRLTLELKCAGLDAEEMARRAVPPSDLSLLGLVRHLAGGEQFWFRMTMAGQQSARPRHFREQPGWDFDGAVANPEVVAAAWQEYARHMGHADFLRERIDGRVGQ
jgi:Protein of unknown function (DUF664)